MHSLEACGLFVAPAQSKAHALPAGTHSLAQSLHLCTCWSQLPVWQVYVLSKGDPEEHSPKGQPNQPFLFFSARTTLDLLTLGNYWAGDYFAHCYMNWSTSVWFSPRIWSWVNSTTQALRVLHARGRPKQSAALLNPCFQQEHNRYWGCWFDKLFNQSHFKIDVFEDTLSHTLPMAIWLGIFKKKIFISTQTWQTLTVPN